jgi:ABC-type transport system involved in multi-copper enzyme maturation permease subunit
MALANGVGLFVKEKEERKWDVLLSTPLGSGDILRAKLLAGLVPLAPPTALLLLFWMGASYVSRFSFFDGAKMLTIILLPGLLAYAVGAVASLRAASLRGAFMVAFGIMVGLLAVLPFLAFVAVPSIDWQTREKMLLAISPIPHLQQLAESVRWSSFWYDRDRIPLEAFAWFAGLYGGAILTLLLYMVRSFNRITGRVVG